MTKKGATVRHTCIVNIARNINIEGGESNSCDRNVYSIATVMSIQWQAIPYTRVRESMNDGQTAPVRKLMWENTRILQYSEHEIFFWCLSVKIFQIIGSF